MPTAKTAGVASMGRKLLSTAVKSRVGRGTASTINQARTIAAVPKARQSKRVLKRVAQRGAVGAGVGAGASALRDRSQGRDVSMGRALAGGFAGAALGGAAGSTVGKRVIRRAMSPRSTPSLTLGESVKSLGSRKGMRAAVKNMAPLEKAFIGVSAIDTAKQLRDPSTEGSRGGVVGSAAGETAGLMAASQWSGMRRVRKLPGKRYTGVRGGMVGSMARALGVIGAGTVGGGLVGSRFDNQKPPKKEAPYG